MKKRILSCLFLFILPILFYLDGLGEGFQERNKSTGDLQHEVTVTLKLIQVYVMDKDGNSAMDLAKENFEIYDNNKRMELTEFEKYTLELPAVEKKVSEEIIEPEPEEKIQPLEKMARKFFLFFDFAYNNATGFEKSKKAALHFIDTQLQPTDEVGILSYSSMKSLVLHEYLTTDHQKVREVVDGFGVREVLGRAYNVEAKYWSQGASPYAEDGAGFDISTIGLDRRASKNQAINYSLITRELGKALRYIPGNKHIILFSSGIASSLIYGHSPKIGTFRKGSFGDAAIRNRYESMMKELAASNSHVFALDTEELGSTVMRDDEATGRRSLKKLAKVTGGKYYDNLHEHENIMDDIQTLTGSYYVLGYYINEKWDGKYHKIKVKVKKKGYEVHAQGGYYNPKPFTEYSKLEKQLHLVDLALTERPLFQDPIRFPLDAVFKPGEKKTNLQLVFEIPAAKLEEISGQKVEIVSLVFNERDDIVAFDRVEKDFSEIQGDELRHTAQLEIPPGKYKCRVVIRNLETGKGAVGSISVKIMK